MEKIKLFEEILENWKEIVSTSDKDAIFMKKVKLFKGNKDTGLLIACGYAYRQTQEADAPMFIWESSLQLYTPTEISAFLLENGVTEIFWSYSAGNGFDYLFELQNEGWQTKGLCKLSRNANEKEFDLTYPGIILQHESIEKASGDV